MSNAKAALVLTGNLLPGYDAEAVWPALAEYFRMERDVFNSQVFDRLPMTIKESEDLEKLHKLRDGANAVGAEAIVATLDGSNLFILPGETPRGPLPRSWIESRVRDGEYPSSLRVAPVGSNAWTTWSQFAASAAAIPEAATQPAAPRPAPLSPQSTDTNSTYVMPRIDAATMAAASVAKPGQSPARSAGDLPAADALPPGAAIHAGFWRRCAALMLDSLILLIPSLVVRYAMTAAGSDMLGSLVVIAGTWVYFAFMESSAMQATIGKRVMDLKVTDDTGSRIGFGRATGRYFGKIVSWIILGIGFMMAGWTPRKQALHDLMASCCVVFRDVHPGEPLPTVRPPMPWYGWVLNVLPFLAAGAMIWAMAAILRAFGM